MGIKIEKVASYLPEKLVTNYDFEKSLETSHEWIKTRTGIETRQFAQGEDLSELIIKSVENLSLSDLEREKIKLILVATCTSKYEIPSIASKLQKQLGLSEDIFALDINMACSGYVAGMNLVNNMLEEGQYGLLIGGEIFSEILNFQDRTTAILFGDGAGASLIRKDGSKSLFKTGIIGDEESLYYRDFLHMDGKKVYKFAIDRVYREIETFLSENKLDRYEIDYFICHQANSRIIDNLAKKLDLNLEKFPSNLYKRGNLSSASIPVLLEDIKDEKILEEGKRLLFIGFGAGLSWSLAYIEC